MDNASNFFSAWNESSTIVKIDIDLLSSYAFL